MAGFPGTGLSKSTEGLFRETLIGGAIFFRRNLNNPYQGRKLVHQLQSIATETGTGWPLLIGVDEEGGRVTRLPTKNGDSPTARELGLDWSGKKVKSQVNQISKNLKRFGMNIDFAPVLDVDTNPLNPVIGDRSFGADPKQVARLGRVAIRTFKRNRIFCCAKHFPGHGNTSKDSHLDLPVVQKSRRQIEAVELVPFRMAVRERVEMVMTAHVLYPKLDPKNPTTCSQSILTGLLRNRLGYKGVIITDDLEMKGIQVIYPFETVIYKAVQAGVDILLVCHSEEKIRETISVLNFLVRTKKISMDRIDRSMTRIRRLKSRLIRNFNLK